MNTDHVVLNVHFQAAPGREEEVANQLKALVAPTRNEAGCLKYLLHRDPENAGKFMFYEEFADESALQAHVQTPHFQAWVQYQASHEHLLESTVVTKWRSIA